MQLFATIGPLALALGLVMIAGEFDLSIGGAMSLAGCVAVLLGADHPALGIAAAVLLGALLGAAQAIAMVRTGISSIGVTLAGLLICSGLAYMLTGNTTIGYDRIEVATAVNAPILGVLSMRSLTAVAIFVILGAGFAVSRLGRDLVATGSGRAAARTAGVPVDLMLIGTFAVSGMLVALSGSLLSYGLAAASPIALSDALVPATVAAIIGGVSLSGGKGSPVGIAGGALVFCLLRSGLISLGVKPYLHDIAIGGLLLTVAFLDARGLEASLYRLARTGERVLGRGTR
nr:ABC transporter permease [Rhodoplanes tepidamans]